MKKNEQYEITIEDISNEGAGIGHLQTDEGGLFAVFVKDAVPGDRCLVQLTKVKKSYAFARLMNLITPGEDRVQPLCKNAACCGGCTMMQLSYPAQLALKEKKVKDCLTRIGGVPAEELDAIMEPIERMEIPFYFRNKMQFPVGVDKDGRVQIGFYASRTHLIIDLERCPIGHPVNDCILRHIRPVLQAEYDKDPNLIYNEESHTGLLRHILTRVGYTSGEVMVCFVINGEPEEFRESLRQKLADALQAAASEVVAGGGLAVAITGVSLNINKEKTNRILGDRTVTIFGADVIRDTLLGVEFEISPVSFYQVNPVQTEKLYKKVAEYAGLSGGETVWDLYCGIGTISLSLARQAKKVFGVEIVPQAIEDAKKNARRNGIDNAEFYCGKAEDVATDSHGTPDCVVVDPPRKGCDPKLIETILKLSPPKVVYVSCDPATLARDIKLLAAGGYRLQKAQVFDQFCHSSHCETCCLLTKANDSAD